MTPSLEQVLGSCRFSSDEQLYRLLRLPRDDVALAAAVLAEHEPPFGALIVDKREVTLLLRDNIFQNTRGRLEMATLSKQGYRLITFDEALEPDLVGFIARISEALATAGVPILAFAAYSRDHILVPAEAHSRAMSALRKMRDEIRQGQ